MADDTEEVTVLTHRHLTTPRLRLDAVVAGDLDDHVGLMSDPCT